MAGGGASLVSLAPSAAPQHPRAGSRRNIHAHYDLGNDFYQRWLDATMTYSSALFAGDLSRSLEQAQVAKYERILARRSAARATVCWRSAAAGAASPNTRRARAAAACTASPSRAGSSRSRAAHPRAGLGERVTLEFRDYRDLQGSYDHVVSIEMYEAVGERYWPTYFRTLRERLKPGGRAMVQAITIADELFERYRRGTDFIQQYIFPGGMLASPAVFRAQARARRPGGALDAMPSGWTTPRRSGAGTSASTRPGARSRRRGSTRASSGCGTSICPTARPGFGRAPPTSCKWR